MGEKRGIGGRKGAATLSMVLFSVITAIVGFLILLYFILNLDANEFSVDEVCKLSVLTRATTPDAFNLRDRIPLKCTTKKICITDRSGFLGIGKGKCEQFAGESEIKSVVLSAQDAETNAKEIEKAVADEMLSCWKAMGEGKIDLLSETGTFEEAKPSCIICSRIALDEDFVYKDKKIDRSYTTGFDGIRKEININEYLERERAPNSEYSYLSLFTDTSVQSFGTEFKEKLDETSGKGTTEMAVLFSQINIKLTPEDAAKETALWGAGFVIGGSSALSPLRKIIVHPLGALTALIGIGIASGIAYKTAAENQVISAAYCGEFLSGGGGEDLRNGCSVVTVVDYTDISQINSNCKGGTLGNP